MKHRDRLAGAIAAAGGVPGCDAVLRRRLALPASGSEAEALAEAVEGIPPALDRAAALLCQSGNDNDKRRGATLKAWLALPPDARLARWDDWKSCFLTNDGKPYADRSLATKGGLKDNFNETIGILRAEAERVFAFEETRRGWRLHAASLSLLALAQPVLAAYTARKARAGAVDFDDLIAAAQRLLTDPGSAWVLYKLDGGLDHLLLDEAQDSNPAQWDIAAKLAEEFFAGSGTRDEGIRSIFAVGDEKQSIYGFQGADAAGFARWQSHFSTTVPRAGARFEAVPLQVSFRSTAPVLALVDAVFAEGPPGAAWWGMTRNWPTAPTGSAKPDLSRSGRPWPSRRARRPSPGRCRRKRSARPMPPPCWPRASPPASPAWCGRRRCPPRATGRSAPATSWCCCAAAPAFPTCWWRR
ncbi:UvrD-helicase domain-containing protein [Pseudoroseomonas wenyumeiae]